MPQMARPLVYDEVNFAFAGRSGLQIALLRFGGRLVGHDVRVLALGGREGWVRDYYREVLSRARDYELVAEPGDYLIWLRRTS